jgi:mutator protein MutT
MLKKKKQIVVIVGIIKNSDEQVLLIKRNEPELFEAHGKWELPGGKIEYGESPQDALAREIKEETGFKVQVNNLLPQPFVWNWEYPDHLQHTILFGFSCTLKNNDSVIKKPQDHHVSAIRWFTFEEIQSLSLLPGVEFFISQK